MFNWSEIHLERSDFLQNPYFKEKMLRGEIRQSATIFGGVSQSEKLSEIKPPLSHPRILKQIHHIQRRAFQLDVTHVT